MKYLIFTVVVQLLLSFQASADAPVTFSAAKVIAKEQIFFDKLSIAQGDLYCGCKWEWVGRSGGRIDAKSCGYETRAQQNRAERIEWEHILSAWAFGHQRQCWQNGGRKNCVATDPVFRAMEANLFNLYPSVGEVNGDRSNYRFGMVQGVPAQYGACPTKVDFKARIAEPRAEAKGLIARSKMYMHDRYGLNMSRQQQQLMMAWDRQYPVTAWEMEWANRTARVMGHHNPFVTGARSWSLGHKPSREGIVSPVPAVSRAAAAPPSVTTQAAIIGNRNSNVYHLPVGCPSYSQVSPRNQVNFSSEAEAVAAGYRKAGNCR